MLLHIFYSGDQSHASNLIFSPQAQQWWSSYSILQFDGTCSSSNATLHPFCMTLMMLHFLLTVVTVNDYLAQRDAEWMGRVHRFLGLSVGLIQVYIHYRVRNTKNWIPRIICWRLERLKLIPGKPLCFARNIVLNHLKF